MFIGHYFDGGDWDDSKIKGIRRALGKWRRWIDAAEADGIEIEMDEFEKKIDSFVESFKFNKVISTMSEFYNKNKGEKINKETADRFEQMIACFAPNFKK